MNRTVPFVVVAILACSLGCKEDVPKGDALARVDDSVLTVQEFNADIPLEYAMSLTPVQKMAFVQTWINTELLYQEAIRQGFDEDRRIATRLKQIERELLANEFLQRELVGKTNISIQEAELFFQQHESEFNTEIKIAQILVSSQDTANALLARIKEGADFAELAKQHSLDPSREAGGVLDYIRRGDMASTPEREDAAFALKKPGQISDVIENRYGYYIVKLIARRRLPKPAKFEDVSDRVRNMLLVRRQKEIFEVLIDGLRAKAEIEVHPELLAPYSPAPFVKPEGS